MNSNKQRKENKEDQEMNDFSSKSVLRNERYVDVIHVTVFKNVAFKIASEVSYVYILSGQKFIKNA